MRLTCQGCEQHSQAVELSASPVFDDQGRVKQVVQILHPLNSQSEAASSPASLTASPRAMRGEVADALREVALLTSSGESLSTVLDAILEQLGRVVQYDSASITLVESDGCRIIAGCGFPPDFDYADIVFPPEDEKLRWMKDTRQPFVIQDAHQDPEWHVVAGTEYIRSWIGAPLLTQSSMIGTLNLDKREPGYYEAEDAMMVMAFANQAAVIIENARLLEAERQRAAQLALIADISQQVLSILDPETLLNYAVEAIEKRFGYYYVDVFLSDPEGEYLIFQTGSHAASVSDWPEGELKFRIGEEGITGHVAATGEPYLTNDVRQDPLYVADPLLSETCSELAVPIQAGERVIGVLDLNSDRIDAFGQDDVFVAQNLADQLAIGLENARLYQAAERRVAELEAVRQASLSLTASLELQEVLEQILESTIQLLEDVQNAHIFLYQDGRLGFGAALWADGRKDTPWAEPRPHGLTYTVARQGELIWVPDMATHPLFEDAPAEWKGSIVGLPLKIGERVVGVMSIAFQARRELQQPELHIMHLLADQAAIAIENARLFTAERQRRLELQSVQSTATALSAELHLDTLLDQITTKAAQAFRAEATSLMLWDEDQEHLVIQSAYGLSDAYKESQRIPRQRVEAVMENGSPPSPIYIPDLSDAAFGDTELIGKEAIRSSLSLPLEPQRPLLGVLNIYSKGRVRVFSPTEIELAQTFAAQATIAIKNARLFEQTGEYVTHLERKTRDLELVHQVSTVISSSLDLEHILKTTAEQMVKVFDADHSGIMLFDTEGNYGQVVAECPPTGATQERFSVEDYLGAQHLRAERKPLMIRDVRSDPLMAGIRDTMTKLDIHSMLIVPLIAKGEVIGSIGLDSVGRERYFSDEEIALAQTIANQVAYAIENAALYQETQQHLRELTLLFETSAAVSSSLDTDRVIYTTAQRLTMALHVQGCAIYLRDRERDVLVGLIDYSDDPESWQPEPVGILYPLADYPATRWVLDTRQPKVIQVSDPDADPAERKWMIEEDVQSVLMVPMVVRDRVIGLVELMEADRERAFTATEARLAQTVANQAAAALENARLFEETEARVREMSAMAIVGQAMTTLELDQVLDSVAKNALEAAQAEISSVYLLDEDQEILVPRSVHGLHRQELEQGIFALGEGTIGQVALSGTPLIVDDIDRNAAFVPKSDAAKEIQTTLTVPLTVKGRVIGTLEVCNKVGKGRFTLADQRLLTAFGAQAAIAIENARLYQELSWHLEEVLVLNKVSAAATSTLDFDEAIRLSLSALRQMPHFERVHVLLLDPDRDELWLHPASAEQALDRLSLGIPVGQGICGQVAATGKPKRVGDVRQEDNYIVGYPDTLSELAVPLQAGDQFIGVLDVQNSQVNAFSENDERLLSTLAGQLSTVFYNVRLLDETQQRLRELTALMQVSQALNEAQDLNTILDIVLEEVYSLLGSSESSIILVDPPSSDKLRIVAERGLGHEVVEAFNNRPVYAHEGTYKRALRSGKMIEVADTATDPDFLDDVGSQAKKVTNIPLMTERGGIGVIAVDRLPRDDTTRRLLTSLADMAAVAIDKERLHQETTDRLAEVSTLYTLSTQITSSLSLVPVLESIVTILKLTLDCRACCIFLVDATGEYLKLQAGTGLDPNWKDTARLRIGEGVSGRVIDERRSIYVPDTKVEPDFIFFDPNIRSLLVVPLIVRDKAIGTLSIDDVRPYAFENELRLLTIAAAQAAVAIDNARLYESLQKSYHELEQAYNELRDLDKMKSEFVQNISHELRTPLTFIKGYVELLIDGDMGLLNDEQIMAAHIVADKAEGLSQLVDDIISLQQAGREELSFERISLTNLGHAAVQAAQASALEAGVQVRDEIPAELDAPVRADKRRLAQVFDNLLGNAIKFSNPGDTVTVRMTEQGSHIRTEVEDTGIGIPPEKLPRIFDRFYQVDGTTTRRFGGTGLGLAIVKQIVESHGGQVGAKSELGEGSTLYFTLPKAKPEPKLDGGH